MDGQGLRQDAITCSSLISALAKGKQWALALQVRGAPLHAFFCLPTPSTLQMDDMITPM